MSVPKNPQVATPEAPIASNVLSLEGRLTPVPSPASIEAEILADEAAEELVAAEEFDTTRIAHRARAINGALNTFDFVKLTGREYWYIYGKSPKKETFIKWVMAAKKTIDDILMEYPDK